MSSRPVEELTAREKEWVRRARMVRRRAYAPYSRYTVGCVVVDTEGRVFTGCNVENSSFPASMCAERVAVGKMVSLGARAIETLVLVTSSEEPAMPCGVCRQVLFELGRDAKVIAVNGRGTVYRRTTMRDLFPMGFGVEELVNR
jgi:cytidine deaminase